MKHQRAFTVWMGSSEVYLEGVTTSLYKYHITLHSYKPYSFKGFSSECRLGLWSISLSLLMNRNTGQQCKLDCRRQKPKPSVSRTLPTFEDFTNGIGYQAVENKPDTAPKSPVQHEYLVERHTCHRREVRVQPLFHIKVVKIVHGN